MRERDSLPGSGEERKARMPTTRSSAYGDGRINKELKEICLLTVGIALRPGDGKAERSKLRWLLLP